MFRKLLTITTSLSLLLTAPVRSNELPLPQSRVWKGGVACVGGGRQFSLLSLAADEPVIIFLGPRKQDGDDGRWGMMTADIVPDSRGVMLKIRDTVVSNGTMPTILGLHVDPKDSAIYGGIAGIPECEYVEALVAHDQEASDNLTLATADPQKYTETIAHALTAPPPRGTTAKEWAGLVIGVAVFAGMVGVTGGMIGKGPGWTGLQFKAHGPGHSSGEAPPAAESPSVGGNVHGHGDADVHGNPWGG